ncbi:MAG: hypothetical protein HY775_12020 [Acidobacteria bacterium]|nr:hypothetical protein [Acidobacteriota bacterium]
MKSILVRRVAVALCAALELGPAAGAAHGDQSAAARLRAVVEREAAARGLDGAVVLAAPLTLDVLLPDGTSRTETRSIGELIDRFAQGTIAGSGPAGTPEINVGDVVHGYINIAWGSALAYSVHDSAVVPATPPVFLPPPATGYLYDAGGPVRNVKGSYLIGLHTAGTVFGSNVDTAAGPAPYPVWLPVVTGGLVLDGKIDFAGHGVVAQGQFCFLGLCVAAGFIVGDGATLFDNSSPVSLPTVP